ncbi:MAG TPA: hypothetical protein PLA94_19595 [Myxococcota bacterium]|nr:hypothetical protein [Myxococcota bacterium]
MYASLLTMLLSCGAPEEIPAKPDVSPPLETDHGTPPGHEFTTFEGEVHWTWGFDESPDALLCDMWWDAVGTPINKCPDCTWAFRVEMTLDESRSQYEAECLGDKTDPNLSWRVGLNENFYGYNVPLLMYYDGATYGDWLPGFVSSWTYPALTWGGGWPGVPAVQDDQELVYTNYWYGTATVK